MPLPRFDRLGPEAQQAFLAVARRHFARDGRDAASLNRILEDSEVSRTSGYNYFDGKDDLFQTVVQDSVTRVLEVLGDWPRAVDEAGFWRKFHDGTAALATFFVGHPDDLAILGSARPDFADEWLRSFYRNAVGLGLVDESPGAVLLERATLALILAADKHQLASSAPARESSSNLEVLLRRLWHSSPTA